MMDSLLLYKILKNRTGAEISASGNPAIMSDTLKNNPMNEMKVFGWSKQETTKGKNLFDFSRLVSDGVNAIDYEKQTITIPARTNNTGYNQTLRDLCPGITPGTYVLSMKRSNPESSNLIHFLEGDKDYFENTPIELTDELLDNHIAWYNNQDSDVENVISEIQIENGTEATDYEPYTGGKPSPSPDYPQEIKSVGDSGSVAVKVTGKNLLNPALLNSTFSADGISAKQNSDGRYTISGTPTVDGIINTWIGGGWDNTVTIFTIPPGNYYSNVLLFYYDGKNRTSKRNAFTLLEPFRVTGAMYSKEYAINEKYNFLIAPQLELGSTATSYEPYYEEQTVALPYILNAIPVSSGGNYTDADGKQWIADYIDFKRGKLVKIVNSLILDGDKLKFVEDPTNTYWNLPQQSAVKPIGYDVLSNYFKIKVFFSNEYSNFIYTTQKNMVGLFETVDELNAFVVKKYRENDAVVLYYRMQEPIETDLTPEEIQAYKNLVTYAGTTIVENDAECYMEVSASGGDSLRAKKLALILGE